MPLHFNPHFPVNTLLLMRGVTAMQQRLADMRAVKEKPAPDGLPRRGRGRPTKEEARARAEALKQAQAATDRASANDDSAMSQRLAAAQRSATP